MCGIAGLFGRSTEAAREGVTRMLAALVHRGPDDEGLWAEEGVCLGQRRLAVIDLSPAGRQPMRSACGRWTITLNGEIYNFRQMREALDAERPIAWRGRSDTEVLLETIARIGPQAALQRARGMFALGLWDGLTRTAWLARDRLGEKPLYFSETGGALVFASELAALSRALEGQGDLCPDALAAYLRFGYVPAPLSILRGARKLEPGELLVWRAGDGASQAPYWSLAEVARTGASDRIENEEDAAEALDALLRTVVARQMIADVPLGVFLSGGIDSSLVTAMMQSVSPTPVRTFTLGFESPEYDEADHAAAVAHHLGTEHTEHRVTPADALAVAPRLGALYDEPFADPSQIPTFMISDMARRHVTVCLTGDGGDEMFGGYVRYPGVLRLWNVMRRAPARRLSASAVEALPLGVLERGAAALGPLARGYAAKGSLAPSLRRAAGWWRASSRDALFEATMTLWPRPPLLRPPAIERCWRPAAPSFDNPLEPMLWRDGVDYLPGDILAKVDRAAMAVSLETRVPLLDADVVALAWRFAPDLKVRGPATKRILRKVLARHVPPALTERPKAGFTPPLAEWLAGPLRAWARDLADESIIARQGVLDGRAIGRAWRALEAGDTGHAPRLWAVVMFQAWRAAHGGG